MDLRGLLHNRWAWAGVGVAGLAGLVAFMRRRRSSSAAGGSAVGASNASPAYASGPVGGPFDSTGTDVANWMGQYSGNLQNQLNEYKQSLTDAVTAISQIPTAPAAPAAPATTAPAVASPQTPAALPTSLGIAAGSDVYAVAQQVWGDIPGGMAQLRALNPGIDASIYWVARPGNPAGNQPYFTSDTTIITR